MTTEEEPKIPENCVCPSWRLRRVKQTLYDTICKYCKDGKGVYEKQGIRFVCGFFHDFYLPRYLEQMENLRKEDYVRRQLRGHSPNKNTPDSRLEGL